MSECSADARSLSGNWRVWLALVAHAATKGRPPSVRRHDEERVELLPLLLGETLGEGGEHLLLRPATGFPAQPFQG